MIRTVGRLVWTEAKLVLREPLVLIFVFAFPIVTVLVLGGVFEEGDQAFEGAPVTVIVGYDTEFYERLPELFPHSDARSWFVGKDDLIQTTAFRNGTLQGAYLIIAARAVGLDCGPMSGFDNAKVDAEFFPGGKVRSNFLCNLGHGDPSALFPRSPRLDFAQACELL